MSKKDGKLLQPEFKPGTELLKSEEIEGTPFNLVCNEEDKQFFIAMGNVKISEVYENRKDALQQVKTVNYKTIINLIYGCILNHENFKQG